jgi:hypothetical protein
LGIPISDFGVRQIVEPQTSTDPAAPVVDDDLQQPMAERLRGSVTTLLFLCPNRGPGAI